MTTPEATRKRRIRERVTAMGCEYHALVNPNEKYWPDAVILVPGGKAVFAEIKKDNPKIDLRYREQSKTLCRLAGLDFHCFMVDSNSSEKHFLSHIEELCAQAR